MNMLERELDRIANDPFSLAPLAAVEKPMTVRQIQEYRHARREMRLALVMGSRKDIRGAVPKHDRPTNNP